MSIWKNYTFLSEIEASANCWGQLIVGELEKNGQSDAEHVARIFEIN